MTSREFQRRFGSGSASNSEAENVKPQIRLPKMQEPNKTEAAFIEHRKRLGDWSRIAYEPITFRLPSGTKYTPDVVVFRQDGGIECWEVKGPHIHNPRSVHAFKEARAAYPMFKWGFAQLRKGLWATA